MQLLLEEENIVSRNKGRNRTALHLYPNTQRHTSRLWPAPQTKHSLPPTLNPLPPPGVTERQHKWHQVALQDPAQPSLALQSGRQSVCLTAYGKRRCDYLGHLGFTFYLYINIAYILLFFLGRALAQFFNRRKIKRETRRELAVKRE